MPGIEDLAGKYAKAAAEAEQFLRKFLLEMGKRALAKTKHRTPVDTGLLRNSWALGEVQRRGDKLEITLYNPVEYAIYVEYGHKRTPWGSDKRIEAGDWVQGRFMATLSIMEVEKEMPTRFRRAFAAWMGGLS